MMENQKVVVLTKSDIVDIVECIRDYACGIPCDDADLDFDGFKSFVESFIEDWSITYPFPSFAQFIYDVLNGVSFRQALHTPDRGEEIQVVFAEPVEPVNEDGFIPVRIVSESVSEEFGAEACSEDSTDKEGTILDDITRLRIEGLLYDVDPYLYWELWDEYQHNELGMLYRFMRFYSELDWYEMPRLEDMVYLIRLGVIYNKIRFIEAVNTPRDKFREVYASYYGIEVPVEE